MKAIIEKKVEQVSNGYYRRLLNGDYFTKIITTIYFLKIPVYCRIDFVTTPPHPEASNQENET